MTVKAVSGMYGKYPTLSIHEASEKSEEIIDKPIISFGVKKAKAILEAVEEIKKFVEENDK